MSQPTEEEVRKQAEVLGYKWELWGNYDLEQVAVWLDALAERPKEAEVYRPWGVELVGVVIRRKRERHAPRATAGDMRLSSGYEVQARDATNTRDIMLARFAPDDRLEIHTDLVAYGDIVLVTERPPGHHVSLRGILDRIVR